MRTKADPAVAPMAAFVADAASAGARPPIRLLGQDVRGWKLLDRSGDSLFLDEFGDLWWARSAGGTDARVIRACWPEERRSLGSQIASAVAGIRARIAHPAGRARRPSL